MRTLIILLATGLVLSFTGVASAASTPTPTPKPDQAALVVTKQIAKTTTKRRIVRQVLPSQSKAMPVFSDKGWIAVSKTSNAKTAIVRPKASKSRTPNMFGR